MRLSLAVSTVLLAFAILAPLASANAPRDLDAPGPSCAPTSGGMDYHSYLCVDPGNPKCAVYTLTHNDWEGIRKRCYGVIEG